MKNAEVDLDYVSAELDERTLSQCGSEYFSRQEAGRMLAGWFQRNHKPEHSAHFLFPDRLLAVANEVLPEAALADPIADLDVWEEWRTGTRRFPFPGVYSRLGLFEQVGKVTATSSVGALGEIITGLLALSQVGPLISARPIRHWPDFIFFREGRYHFVESKASTLLDDEMSLLGVATSMEVPRGLLEEGLVTAVKELGADPTLAVWLCFPVIRAIEPLRIRTLLARLTAPPERRRMGSVRIPRAVLLGLADRIYEEAASVLDAPSRADPEPDLFSAASRTEVTPESLFQRVRALALEMARTTTLDEVDEEASSQGREELLRIIRERRCSKSATLGQRVLGKRLVAAKQFAHRGRFGLLRHDMDRGLFLADLPDEEIARLRTAWRPDWKQATAPFGWLGATEVWRFSTALLAFGPLALEGEGVSKVRPAS